jgi:hypothetical protein
MNLTVVWRFQISIELLPAVRFWAPKGFFADAVAAELESVSGAEPFAFPMIKMCFAEGAPSCATLQGLGHC